MFSGFSIEFQSDVPSMMTFIPQAPQRNYLTTQLNSSKSIVLARKINLFERHEITSDVTQFVALLPVAVLKDFRVPTKTTELLRIRL
jgi:hypothetical protein